MSTGIKITSMRCPDCGGAIEPLKESSVYRCPYCNSVLHIEDKAHTSGRNTPSTDTEKTTGTPGQTDPPLKKPGLTLFDAVVFVLTIIGMVWIMWTYGNELLTIAVAWLGIMIIGIHVMVKGQIFRGKRRWE